MENDPTLIIIANIPAVAAGYSLLLALYRLLMVERGQGRRGDSLGSGILLALALASLIVLELAS